MELSVLLVPYDSGYRGLRMGAGPEALMNAGLATRLESRGHDVRVQAIDLPADSWPSEISATFTLARLVADAVSAARKARRTPVVLSGNCAAALGVCAALGGDTRVAWLDAHADFNTPDTTIGGFLDGMALATLTGRCWSQMMRGVAGYSPIAESHVWLLGARDLDPLEQDALERSEVQLVSAAAIGPATAQRIVSETGDAPLYLHVDLDVLDANDARANSYAVGGGVTPAALVEFCGTLSTLRVPDAVTVSAYDPAADTGGRARDAAFAVLDALCR